MKLSLIVCLYNTPKTYFDECLSSIRNSTLKKEDYEILVIDDGSSEDYSDVINKHCARVIKTENRGIFRARILGIEEALGDYVAFVDSDDTVSFNYHLPMMLSAEENDLDVCFNDWAFHTERTRYACFGDSSIATDFTYERDEVLPAFLKNEGREHSYFVLWNKLFKASVLKEILPSLKPIAEGEGRYNYSEDTLICFFAFKNSKKIANVHTGYYFYRIHSNQTVNIVSAERLESHIKYMSQTLDLILENLPDTEKRAEMEISVKKWAGLMSRTHYSHAKANKYSHLYDYIQKSYHVEVLKKSTFHDNSAYSKNKVLPVNILEIDRALLSLWSSNDNEHICLCEANKYMKRSVRFMKKQGKKIKVSPEGRKLPTPRVKLIDRIIMNKFVYTLGLIFFKKGSKIRAFLKKHI